MKRWIESHMNMWLIAGGALGLLWPSWAWVPDGVVIAILMLGTYLACFRVQYRSLTEIYWRPALLFLMLRFMLLPLTLYFIARPLHPEMAIGILLVAALPVGVSSPAMTNVFGGQVLLAIFFTLVTTILTPLLLPLYFGHVAALNGHSAWDMMTNLLLILLLPGLAYLATFRIKYVHRCADDWGKAVTIVLIALMIAVAVGKQRHIFLANPQWLIESMALSFILLAGFLCLGWWWARRMTRAQRIAYAVCSGFNNAALGISLALLHFSPEVIVFAVGAELAWVLLPWVMNRLLRDPPP